MNAHRNTTAVLLLPTRFAAVVVAMLAAHYMVDAVIGFVAPNAVAGVVRLLAVTALAAVYYSVLNRYVPVLRVGN
jgi:hypothetical protein